LHEQLGDEHLLTVGLVIDLADTKKALGRYFDAEFLYRSAMDILKRKLGDSHAE
jgi:hypothetical protein